MALSKEEQFKLLDNYYAKKSIDTLGKQSLTPEMKAKLDIITAKKQPMQQPTITPEMPAKDFLTRMGETAKGIGVGALKGLGTTLTGMSELGEKGMQKVLGIQQPTGAEELQLREKLKPQTTAEKAGMTLEQIGEFFVPGAAGIKAGKSASLLTKIGVEAATMGGITATQTGKVGKEAGISAGIGATLPVVGKLISKIPETAWNKILERTPAIAIKKPELGKKIAEQGIVGTTRKNILGQSVKNIQKLEMSMDELLKTKTGEVSTSNVVAYLDDLKNAYKNIPGEESAVNAIEEIGKQVLAKGKTLPVLEANKLKRDIYNIVGKSYGKGTMEIPAKTESQKLIARGLKEEIEKVIPGVKDLNAKQAIFIETRNALQKTIARREGKGIAGTGIGLFDLLIGFGGYTAMGPKGLALFLGKKVAESPALLSGVSKMLTYFDKLSPTKKILFYNALKGLAAQSIKKD